MRIFSDRRALSMAIAAAVCCFGASANLAAATAPNVTYTAAGTFATPPASGNDLFQLQGQPFSISVVASESSVSKKHGAQWADYTALSMTGTVQSGLLPTPISLSNGGTSIELAVGNPSYDVFILYSPVKVVGMTLTIVATLHLPKGTLTNDHILPVKQAALTPAIASMTYSDGTNTTVLGINGTLSTTVPAAITTKASAVLHGSGAQSIVSHGDGTQSVRSLNGAVLDLSASFSSDTVALQLYAEGVRDASEVQVQIAGQTVPVLYAGAASHFPDLDQISVQVPHSLAGIGDAEVLLTVDGGTTSPVHVQIQ